MCYRCVARFMTLLRIVARIFIVTQDGGFRSYVVTKGLKKILKDIYPFFRLKLNSRNALNQRLSFDNFP